MGLRWWVRSVSMHKQHMQGNHTNTQHTRRRISRDHGLTLRSFLAVCSCSSMFSSVLSDDAAPSLLDVDAGAAATGAGREPPPAPPSALLTFAKPLLGSGRSDGAVANKKTGRNRAPPPPK